MARQRLAEISSIEATVESAIADLASKEQKNQVNKQSAREIIYSGNNDEYDLTRRRIILTPKTQDDYFLFVTYTADNNDYEQYLPDVEQVFRSIDLLE